MSGKNGVGARGKYENIVGNDVPGGCLDGLGAWVDFGDSRVEMVIKASLFELLILFDCISFGSSATEC